jgi:hypothetical protein
MCFFLRECLANEMTHLLEEVNHKEKKGLTT